MVNCEWSVVSLGFGSILMTKKSHVSYIKSSKTQCVSSFKNFRIGVL